MNFKTLNILASKTKNKYDINIAILRVITQHCNSDKNEFSRIFGTAWCDKSMNCDDHNKLYIRVYYYYL